MRNLCLLLGPRVLAFRKSFAGAGSKARKRAFVVTAVGLLFWVGMFVGSGRVLVYFQSVEVIGDLLAHHLLSMVLLTFFCLLIFSHIITSLSNLYLSRDLELCHSMPAHLEEVFLSRVIHTVIDSSWMVVVFGLPVMMAYAFVYRPGPGYYVSLLHMGLALTIISACLGILLTVVLVYIFPAQRTRDIIMLLVILLIIALYFMFRFLRPERLVDPEAFFSAMQYMSALKAPDSLYLPTHWVTEVLWDNLVGSNGKYHVFEAALVWSTAAAMVVISIWVAEAIYFEGFSKAQEAKRSRKAGRTLLNLVTKCLTKPMGHDLASVVNKDVRAFFRDNSQWSQLLLLGALVVVYLYNFSVLPLGRSPMRLEFLQNEIAFLNMGLAGFVLSAVSVRFIFPAVSAEGEAFWIIHSSPLSIKRFLWGKYALYLPPMILLAEVLIILTNRLLHVTPFMMVISSVTMFLAVFGIVAMGIGFGALYPNFRHQNIAQVATGFGGVLYMIVATSFIALVVVLEAAPVYIVFMANHRGEGITSLQWLLIVPAFLMVVLIIVLAVYKPMQMGIIALKQYE